jgi:Ca2+-binding EF-hand superfamily protein
MLGMFKSKVHALPPSDPRIDKWKTKISLADEDIMVLYDVFNRYDKEGGGFLSTGDYFLQLLQIQPTLFTIGMFDLIETQYAGKITFGEYVDVTCTFALFETMELIKYAFFILDRDKVGEVDIKEVEHFVYLMWDHTTTSNLMMAIEYMHSRDLGDGRVNFHDLVAVHYKYPSVFYPAFRIQATVIATSLGESWWNDKKTEVTEKREQEARMELMRKNKKSADLAREQERLNEEMVMKKMGWKYYVLFWQRDRARRQIAKIAQINKALDDKEKALKLAGVK